MMNILLSVFVLLLGVYFIYNTYKKPAPTATARILSCGM